MDAAGDHGPILVVDDDAALAEMLQLVLIKEGFSTAWVGHGSDVMDVFREHRPALVLLDLMLPGRDGIRICQDIRRESGVPIIMLTAKDTEIDKVLGLELGADDYVTKPFGLEEVVARIRARLRRTDDTPADVLEVGDLTVDVPQHTVTRGEEEIQLTPLEFDLLVEMARKPNQVHSREELLESVWGYRNASDTRLVNVHVQRLRSKIEHDPENPEIILTVRGVGYKTGKSEV